MAKRQLPTQDRLRQMLDYNPSTGKLHWKERGPEWFTANERLSAEAQSAAWNGRNAGREAFTASDGKGYFQGQVDGYHTMAHRVIWAWLHAEWPDCIDHIDGDGRNNRSSNLRSVTRSQNNRNQARRGDKPIGVRFHNGIWEAYITIGRRSKHLGSYKTCGDAVHARRKAELELGFHPNHGQRPPRRVRI